MQIGTFIAIFFIVWWLCLFIVLPFKVRNQVDAGEWQEGTERGAPAGILRLWPKLLITTVLAASQYAISRLGRRCVAMSCLARRNPKPAKQVSWTTTAAATAGPSWATFQISDMCRA